MMKKLIAMLLALALCLGMTACGGEASGADEQVDAAMEASRADLAKRVPDVLNLFMEQYGNDMKQLVKDTFAEEGDLQLTHVAEVQTDDIYGYAAHLILVRLSGTVAAEENGEVFGNDRLIVAYDVNTGKLYHGFMVSAFTGEVASEEDVILLALNTFEPYLDGSNIFVLEENETLIILTEENVSQLQANFAQ